MRTSALCLVAFLMISAFCFSDTIHVPGDRPTIQAGIDAAVNDDIVLVAPGTYVECIDFLGKAITVISDQGPEVTIIDGNRSGTVVSFVNDESIDSELNGFTITNGYSSGDGGGIHCKDTGPWISYNIICLNESAGNGGGIACTQESGPTIYFNTIKQNKTVSGGGGGVYVSNSSPGIAYNQIEGNECGFWLDGKTPPSRLRTKNRHAGVIERTARFEGEGGGVYINNEAKGSVSSNTISHNLAYNGGGICCNNSRTFISGNKIVNNTCDETGGGIDCSDCSNHHIFRNFIAGNEITLGGLGAGIHLYHSTTSVLSNVICRNTNGSQPYYTGYGGGILFNRSSPQENIENNTIIDNYVHGVGGGIACYYDAFPIISNSILRGNKTDSGDYGNEIYVGMNSSSAGMTISYSNVEGGLDSVYVTGLGELDWGDGMIDSDPLFVDPDADDYHLTYPSPCHNTGDNSVIGWAEYDYDGDSRPWYDIVDMGADEFQPYVYCTGEFAPGGMIDLKIIGRPVSQPVLLFVSPNLSTVPLYTIWGPIYLKPPVTMLGPFGAMPSEGVLIQPVRIPSSPAAPYDIFMQAFIKDKMTSQFTLRVR